MEPASEARSLPYSSFGTFLTTLDHFGAVGVPNLIDPKTLPPTISGSGKYEVLGAFRFFRLIDNNGRPNVDRLPPLTLEKTRREALSDMLREYYPGLFDLPLATAGPSEIRRWFTENATASTVGRAQAFFLSAAKQNGIALHPLVAKATRAVTGSIKRKRRKAKATSPTEDVTALPVAEITGQPQAGESRTVRLISGGTVTVTWSVNLWDLEPGQDRDFVFDLIDTLKAYMKNGGPGNARATNNGAAES